MLEEKDVLEAAQIIIDESDLNVVSYKSVCKQLKKQFKCSIKPFKKILKKAINEMVIKKLAREESVQMEESFHLHYTPSMAVDMETPTEQNEQNDDEDSSPQVKKSKKQKAPKQRKHKKRQHVRDEEIAVVSDQDGSEAGAEPEEPVPSLLNDDDIDMDDDQTTGQIAEDKILPAFLRVHEEEEYIPNAPEAGRRKPKKRAPPKKKDPTPKQQQEKIAEIYKESSKIYRDSELVIPMQATEHTPTYAELLERSKKRKEEYLLRKSKARPSSADSSKLPSPQKQDRPTQFAPRLTDPSQDSSEEDSDDDSSDESSSESGEDSMEMDSVSSASIPVMPSLPMGTLTTPATTLDFVS